MQLLSGQLTTSIDVFLQLLHVIQFTCQQVMSQIMNKSHDKRCHMMS
jgi:hypothetical protein